MNSRFEILDRHLLRLSLEQAFEAITGKSVKARPRDYESRIVTMLDKLIPSENFRSELKKFLIRISEPDTPSLIEEARRIVPIGNPRHHVQVIARAALLLRVATGACAWLLRQAGIGKTDLGFWWKPLGEDLGLWEPDDVPVAFTDLWADVEAALKEARKWEIDNNNVQASFARWRQERSFAISVLGGCERIALWGLGL